MQSWGPVLFVTLLLLMASLFVTLLSTFYSAGAFGLQSHVDKSRPSTRTLPIGIGPPAHVSGGWRG